MVNLIPCIFSGNFSCIFHQSEEVPCWRGRVSIYRSEVLPMAMASIRLWSYSATAKSTLLLNAALQKDKLSRVACNQAAIQNLLHHVERLWICQHLDGNTSEMMIQSIERELPVVKTEKRWETSSYQKRQQQDEFSSIFLCCTFIIWNDRSTVV